MPEKKTKAIRRTSRPPSHGPKGRSLFFGIGINEYQHFDPLHNAVKDINDVVSLLEERYELDEKILLLNEKATRENITNHLEDLADLAAPEDKVLIYYSGHGFLREKTGYWIPVDAQPGRRGQFIRNEVIRGCIKDIKARHILLISDSCFSGSLVVNRDVATPDPGVAIGELEKDRSRWVLSSGRQTELVADGSRGENSPFATSILKVLRDNRQPKLNVAVLADKVVKLTRYNWEQMPQGSPLFGAGHEGGQYIFCLAAGEPEAWAAAKKENTITAYQTFLQLYPDGQHEAEARKKLDVLREEEAWTRARRENTPLAYNHYLTKYPNGPHARQALDAMREQEEEAAWRTAKEQDTLYAYRNFAWKYPGGKYQAEAEQRIQQLIAGQERPRRYSSESTKEEAPPTREEKPASSSKQPAPKPLWQQSWFRIAAGVLGVALLIWIAVQISESRHAEEAVDVSDLEAVQDDITEKYGYRAPDGTWVISPQFNDAQNFSDSLAAANRDGLWGFINREGEEVIPFKYLAAERFAHGLAWVADKDRKFGYIDTTGQMVLPFVYDNVGHFDAAGEAWVERDGKEFYINRKGECIRGDCPAREGAVVEEKEPAQPREKPKTVQKSDPPKSQPASNTVALAGQTYRTIRLNGQTWLAENLNYDIGKGSWCYDKDQGNCRKYGRLYTWTAASAACKKLGPGWRLPTDEEWKSLANSVGGYYDLVASKDVGDSKKSYKALLEGGNSGFAALLGGARGPNGTYYHLGALGYYWSGTEKDAQYAWFYYFYGNFRELSRVSHDKAYGFSCRCLKDN